MPVRIPAASLARPVRLQAFPRARRHRQRRQSRQCAHPGPCRSDLGVSPRGPSGAGHLTARGDGPGAMDSVSTAATNRTSRCASRVRSTRPDTGRSRRRRRALPGRPRRPHRRLRLHHQPRQLRPLPEETSAAVPTARHVADPGRDRQRGQARVNPAANSGCQAITSSTTSADVRPAGASPRSGAAGRSDSAGPDGLDLPGLQPALDVDTDLGVGDQPAGDVAQCGVQIAGVLGQQRLGIVRELQRVEYRTAGGVPGLPGSSAAAVNSTSPWEPVGVADLRGVPEPGHLPHPR